MEIGKTTKSLQCEKGMTQDQLAKVLDLGPFLSSFMYEMVYYEL